MTTRRDLLRTAGTATGLTALAGCLSGSSAPVDDPEPTTDADVLVGPANRLTFEPASLSVATGETVTWGFESSGHNVSCDTDHTGEASLPGGADPFASYDGDDKYRFDAAGTTFDHEFTTPGTYVYVCIPHVANGMVGEVVVEE